MRNDPETLKYNLPKYVCPGPGLNERPGNCVANPTAGMACNQLQTYRASEYSQIRLVLAEIKAKAEVNWVFKTPDEEVEITYRIRRVERSAPAVVPPCNRRVTYRASEYSQIGHAFADIKAKAEADWVFKAPDEEVEITFRIRRVERSAPAVAPPVVPPCNNLETYRASEYSQVGLGLAEIKVKAGS